MDSLKRLKLFPDKWEKKLTDVEMRQSRNQLTSYTQAKDLEVSLKEVHISFLILKMEK